MNRGTHERFRDRPRLAPVPLSREAVEVVGTVVGTPELRFTNAGRPLLALELQTSEGAPLRVTLRGSKARRFARVVVNGSELQLKGRFRVVRYFAVRDVAPASEPQRFRGSRARKRAGE